MDKLTFSPSPLSLSPQQKRLQVSLICLFQTAVEGQSITQPQCSGDPDDPNDFVETANPYSNDQDGCACHSNSTTLGPYCYCLVGYGELVSTFNCTSRFQKCLQQIARISLRSNVSFPKTIEILHLKHLANFIFSV